MLILAGFLAAVAYLVHCGNGDGSILGDLGLDVPDAAKRGDGIGLSEARAETNGGTTPCLQWEYLHVDDFTAIPDDCTHSVEVNAQGEMVAADPGKSICPRVLPEGWEPFAYVSNMKLRRCVKP